LIRLISEVALGEKTVNRIRVAIDMDEVIADTYGAMLNWLRHRHGVRWSTEAFHGRQIFDVLELDVAEALRTAMHDGAFFANLPVIEGSQAALSAIAARCELFVTSAAMEFPNSLGPKFLWLRRHFPFVDPLNIVFCGDKSIIAADCLIDDNTRHFKRFGGQGIVFSSPHNVLVSGYPRIHRWDEALAVLSDAFPGAL
jgi:5'(3')-deoxyribonucleotidase